MTAKERKFAEELGKCTGKWVATDDYRVVACGDSIKEVEKKAKESNVDNPVIFPLPDVKEGHNFY